jgi:nicotinate-nucleotide adenylyltransferase
MKVGLMGGSFNPIHNAHMAAADEAVSRFELDEVIFIPCGIPPHKTAQELAPAEDRYLMTVIAINDCPAYSVSRYEIDKPEPGYTVETMRHYKQDKPEAELFFITGADSIEELETWREPERIFDYGTLIAATRPGYTVEKAPPVAEKVVWMEIPPIGISATDIRQRLRDGLPVEHLMPPGVLEYISKQGLYKG